MKLSFLIAAHNEEKIISKALSSLINLPFDSFEVIIGLDGCTDKTEDIIKEFSRKSKKIKYYKLNLRQGKPAVIDTIIKKAKGEIIIINDADWFFDVKNKKYLGKFLSIFNDKKVGGVGESFPMEFYEDNPKRGNIPYKMINYSAYYWMNYQKKRYSFKENGIRCIREPKLFMANIFRKKLYKRNTSLGDDFERTIDIMKQGYKVVLFDDPKMPRMKAIYHKASLYDLFKQKIRTARARDQLEEKGETIGGLYYLQSVSGMLFLSLKDGLYPFFLTLLWVILTTIATLISKFKKFNTKEGWNLRAKR